MESIQIENLSKCYGHEFKLDKINLKVGKGRIFTLIGPNGAGKTTLVKLILNLLHPDKGNIRVNNVDSTHKESRKSTIFIPEKFNFFPYYTAYGVLNFFGKVKGVELAELPSQIDNALRELNIYELKKRKLSQMSKGQVQRVGLASLLIGDNDLIILDEPFSGLDPIGIRDLKEIIKKQNSLGKTFFINSHILMEMEQLCHDVGILNKGKLLYQGSIDSVLTQEKNLDDFFYKIINKDNNT